METFIDNLIDLLSGGEALFALLRSTLIIVVAVTMHWFATRAIKSLRSHISAKWADLIEQRIILGGTVVHAADDGQLAAQGG